MFTTAILLAAGSATRMGADKLLMPYKGRRLIDRALAPLTDCRLIDEIIVVTRPGFPGEPTGPICRTVVNPDHLEGLASSLRAGVAAANPAAGAFAIFLADMPDLTSEIITPLIEAFYAGGKRILVPLYQGRPGHPVILSAACRDDLLRLRGDTGAKQLIREHPERVQYYPTPHRAVVFDVDTPADFAVRPIVRVLIKGAGEQASATAHRLFQCGFHVVMTDLAWPKAVRLTVSFCSAIFDGQITVEGVAAVRYSLDQAGTLTSFDWGHIPVFIDPDGELQRLWPPDVIIDGRMLKGNLDNHADDAPLTIGYGPGLIAGQDVDFVVETNRGHDLGRIITEGVAAPDTGIPGDIDGYTHQRILRAPAHGIFHSDRCIGDVLKAGDVVGVVAERPLTAAIPGLLRGLLHPGSPVVVDQKVGDIDPRGDASYCHTLSDKSRTISGSALEIILSFLNRRQRT